MVRKNRNRIINYNNMNIGVFYQSGYKLVACYMALHQLRKYYPYIPISLYEDGSRILKKVSDEFGCDYRTTNIEGVNYKLSGRPVIDVNSNLEWLGRIYESSITTLKDVDWIIIYEDDVWCKREIIRYPKFDLSGANGPLYTVELTNYLLKRFNTNLSERNHWSEKGTLESYQGCGGTIINKNSFLEAYSKINDIDWSKIYKLDSRPCEWSDASISFVMQYAGFSCGRWDDWGSYNSKDTGSPHNKTGWSIPMSEQEDFAFLHNYKHFYNYANDELDLAIEYYENNLV